MALSGTSKGGIVRNLIRSAKIQVGLIESPLMNCKFNPSIELCVHIPVLRTPVSSLSKSEVISLEFNLWLLQQRISCLCFQYHNYFLRFARAHWKKLTLQIILPFSKPHCQGPLLLLRNTVSVGFALSMCSTKHWPETQKSKTSRLFRWKTISVGHQRV